MTTKPTTQKRWRPTFSIRTLVGIMAACSILSAGYHYIGTAGVVLILFTASLIVGAVCNSQGRGVATRATLIVAVALFVTFLAVTQQQHGH